MGRVRLDHARSGRFEIPLLVGGRRDDPRPVVLLHGFSDTKDSFVDVARGLGRAHGLILPDLPGFSDASQPMDHHYTIGEIARVLADVLQERCPQGMHLVGNSLGGAVAAAMTLEHPQRVHSLTLVCATGLRMPVASALQHHIVAGHNPFVVQDEQGYPAFLRFVLERVPPIPGPLMRVMARRFVARRAMNEKILAELIEDDLDLTDRLGQIEVPTMVLWGDRDRVIDLSVGRAYHQGITDSRLVVLHGVGHCPQVEAPRITAKRIAQTVERAERGLRGS